MVTATRSAGTAAQEQAAPVPAPPKRGLSRAPLPIWVGVVLSIFTMLGIIWLTRGSEGVMAAVATRPLVAGEPVKTSDFRFVEVKVTGELGPLLEAEVLASGLQAAPAVAARPIPEGAIVSQADLTDANVAPSPRAMSIPIDRAHAAGGALDKGDTVDVIDAAGPQAVYVLTGAKVLSVGGASDSKIKAGDDYAVTVAVDDVAALRVAAAIVGDKVEIVRSTGSTPVRAR